MIRKIRSAVALIVALTLILSCAPIVFAANTDLTYREYLAMSTDEQIAFRETFESNADFKNWYAKAKKAYEDSQNDIIIGDGNSVDLGEILNPAVASGSCGDHLAWRLSQKGTLTISGSGSMNEFDTTPAPWSEYSNLIQAVELPTQITSVGKDAFEGCGNITDVYFAGTEKQWSSVTIKSGNGNLANAQMHYLSAVLTNISIAQMPTKTTYDIGDHLDTTGLVITLTYNDNSTSELESGFLVSELDSTTAGVKTITVTYMDKTATFDVTVVAKPSGIKINTLPNKLDYWVGGALDSTGLSLTVTYNDGSTSIVNSGFEITGFDSESAGTKVVTVSYAGFSTTFSVLVNNIFVTGISIHSLPVKTIYWVGDSLDPSGLIVKADYSDGSYSYIESGWEISDPDLDISGSKTVTVTYQGFSDTFDITVNDLTVTGVSIYSAPLKLNYWIGESLDTTGLVLTATYSNNSTGLIETGFEVSGFDSETAGVKTVTVTYQGYTATFDVTVSTGGRCGDDLTWDIVDGVLSITGSGSMYDYYFGTAPWYGEELTDINIDPNVTYIGKFAFANTPCLTAYHIPSSTTVGTGAFAQCANLTAITVDADHPAYYADENGTIYSKDKTTLILVPSGFSGTFTVPNTVTTIADSAFHGCAKLTAIKFQGTSGATGGFTDRETSGSDVYADFVLFGKNNITTIGQYAFAGCEKLTSFVVPENVTVINEATFKNCGNLKSVSIGKNVTVIGENAFSGCGKLALIEYAGRETVSATSTTPAWNKITIAEGNSALDSAAFIYAGEVRISGATLALQHNIAVHYKVKKTTVETYGFGDLKLVVKFNGVTTTITEYEESGDEYIFFFNNIAPNQMNDTIICTLYATRDGKTYTSDEREYSVATYCYTQLGRYNTDAYAEFRTLLVDLLNYGAAAQTYTGYNPGVLVNSELTALQSTWGSSGTPTLTDKTNTKFAVIDSPAVKWKGATLILQDAVTMRYKIQAADISGLTAVFTCDGNTWSVPASEFQAADTSDTYYIFFNGLDAGQMRSLVYVTIYNGDTPVSNTVQYSIESYASGKVATPGLSDIVIAMMHYGDSAYEYVN